MVLWIVLGVQPTMECSPTSAGFICSDPMPAIVIKGENVDVYGNLQNGYGKHIYKRNICNKFTNRSNA